MASPKKQIFEIPKDTASWRDYLEEGSRVFCKWETVLLERFVNDINPDHGYRRFSEIWLRNRPTAIAVWGAYLKRHQTPVQAAERVRSLEKFKISKAATTLEAARQQLNEEIDHNKDVRAYVRKAKQSNLTLEHFDYTKPQLPKVKREGPMRHVARGKIASKSLKMRPWIHSPEQPVHVAAMALEDIPISSRFMDNFCIPEPATGLLRKDPKLGKYIVPSGKASPLRQSVTLICMSDLEHELDHEIKVLKDKIAEFEQKNLTLPRHRTPDDPQYRLVHRDNRPLQSVRRIRQVMSISHVLCGGL